VTGADAEWRREAPTGSPPKFRHAPIFRHYRLCIIIAELRWE